MPIVRRHVTTPIPAVPPPIPANPPVEADPTIGQSDHHMRPYLINPHAVAAQEISFTLTQIATIYGFPAPSPSMNPITIGVVSFGGGLIGTLTNGVLTNGDPQKHWTSLGIASANHPRVLVYPVNGASIPTNPNPGDVATIENTIDVETIGALCPTSNLTIILYITKPTDNLIPVFTAALSPTLINGVTYTPSIISCSWGAPESWIGVVGLNDTNELFKTAAARGILITAATGDFGSSNGTSYTITDFPSSSPHVLACGGTTLICPNGIYDSSTVETVWSGSGGGFSSTFIKPSYQSALPGTYRSTPDISLVADPNTGVKFTIGGVSNQVVGGTSIVSPAMAAFAAVINTPRFLTPLLYTCPSGAFHDITVGSNGAYFGSIGFDHCSGLGSIIGPVLTASIIPARVRVTGVALTGLNTITAGQTSQLIATVAPLTATDKSVTYKSSNIRIATVSAAGLVTGVAAGSAVITVTTVDGSKPATRTVTVTSIRPISVALTGSTTVVIGQTTPLAMSITPDNASNKAVTYRSSNTRIVTVTPGGLVRGVFVGYATITVITADGAKTAAIDITVTPIRPISVALTGSNAVTIGQTLQLKATVLPSNTTNKNVVYVSSNTDIVTVSQTGRVTAASAGSATITVTTSDGGLTATKVITVNPIRVSRITLSTPSLKIRIGSNASISPSVTPLNATNRSVQWSSTNSAVASVTNGVVTGNAKGSAQIRAVSTDGAATAICNVTVS